MNYTKETKSLKQCLWRRTKNKFSHFDIESGEKILTTFFEFALIRVTKIGVIV